jgi:hypothetical protein
VFRREAVELVGGGQSARSGALAFFGEALLVEHPEHTGRVRFGQGL